MKKARGDSDGPLAGKLRIGDMWNAITIIASSQTNPLKAIAEFVENCIDARARHVTIVRGRERGSPYLRVIDDGEGIPREESGRPDFRYVATHICDSVKRRLRDQGAKDIQGEFGIGLLSFWTVGRELTLASAGSDGKTYEMRMIKGDPGYTIQQRRTLIPPEGTELVISPLLPGLRQLTGEKIQWYLASELRDRIRSSGVKVKVVDNPARRQFLVEPRQFSGRLLHRLPPAATPLGEVYLEIYLDQHAPENQVGLYRAGTRVLESIAELERFDAEPWTSGCLQGIVDSPFLRLTPATRGGIIQDEAFAALSEVLRPVEQELAAMIAEQREAEEQRASRQILKTIQRALREALLQLPTEEYDWFEVRGGGRRPASPAPGSPTLDDGSGAAAAAAPAGDSAEGGAGGETADGAEFPSAGEPHLPEDEPQRRFFEFEGPLFSVRVLPSSCVLPVGAERRFRALARDRARRLVERDLEFLWRITEGEGRLAEADGQFVTFAAPPEPGLTRLEVTATQEGISCAGEGRITVTDSLLPAGREPSGNRRGLPGYTYHRAPGELWRSRYDEERNLIVINNGHRDFVFASRNHSRKLRYICRLFAKELVCKNFPGSPPEQLLERMIELTLYSEENLR